MENQRKPNGIPGSRMEFSELPEVTKFGKTLEPFVVARDSLAEETLEKNTDINLSLSCEFFLSMVNKWTWIQIRNTLPKFVRSLIV